MLTLVADVLAYDLAFETWDLESSLIVEAEEAATRNGGRRSLAVSLKERS